jgi:hypothetical protein
MTKSPWELPKITLRDGETAAGHGEYEKLPASDKPRATRSTLSEAIATLNAAIAYRDVNAELKRLKAWRCRLMWAMALNLAWAFVLVALTVYRLFWS